MGYTFTEKKRIRKNFSKRSDDFQVPYLLATQKESYRKYLQAEVPPEQRIDRGIQAAFKSVFPIESYNGSVILEFVSYQLGKPRFDVAECQQRGLIYACPLHAIMRLKIFNKSGSNKRVKEVRENTVFLGDMPLMTEHGTFVINGTERVIVSQLHRSPGVIFDHDGGKTHASRKLLFSARVIPYRGSWLDLEFDPKDMLYVRIDRRRKLPATIMLRALGYSTEEILSMFFENDHITVGAKSCSMVLVPERLRGQQLEFDLKRPKGNKVLVEAGRRITARHVKELEKAGIKKIDVPTEFIIGRTLARAIVDTESGELLADANTEITEKLLENLPHNEAAEIETIVTNDIDCGPFLSETLRIDPTRSAQDALVEIYRMMRPGEPPTEAASKALFENLFFNSERYDLSAVGRMKFNRRLGRESDEGPGTLSKQDIVDVVKKIVALKNGKGETDDIDSLGNRRVRSVGELVENQFRIGLVRVERAVKERLNLVESENLTPQDLINAKPVSAVVKEFFGSSQLSQFMDQTNPLSEVTHKRRVSALGPGGLTRERAGFEVRDVHPTHYGRVCPIETPEGPNIGLINSLACFARTNEYGFMETPYRKVENSKVTGQVDFLSAIEERTFVIAQANAALDATGKFTNELVSCRHKNEFSLSSPSQIDYIDVAPQQIVSVAASLVPFLEHDDANRALMGSNMQRQAVPIIQSEKPLVGTGMERTVAIDSGVTVVARRGGVVDSVDASRIVVRVNDDEGIENEPGVDIYNLTKYQRSNQNTTLNQRPLVKLGDLVSRGDVLADGPATDLGELALGRNVLIAFMPWNGYNFEDSILISERLVKDDVYTSIHIEELPCVARDTTLGSEEISRDIPNVGEGALSKLDESGIVYIGAKVQPGDVLVGKITPKGETQLTPEEKLLRAIFGEKASDVKDTSLRLPSGMKGTVIDVQVFTREGLEKDARATANDDDELARVSKDLEDQLRIVEADSFVRIEKLLHNHVAEGGPNGLKAGEKVTNDYLAELPRAEWFEIRLRNERENRAIEKIRDQLEAQREEFARRLAEKQEKIRMGDDLAPGVLKIVKVFVAVKRRLQPGDKMAGRHGNKGVISKIVPVEDMPYMEDGTTVDICLNPLGVPSRMNVGQVLEAHLGWAAKAIGKQIDDLLRTKKKPEKIRKFLGRVYNSSGKKEDLESFSDTEILELCDNLRAGVPMATPVFDGAAESEIKSMLKLAKLPQSGQITLYDGRTGESFDRPVTCGYMYILKLNHLVDDKMHARSTGPYSLITQQPLGGKAQFGGQRFGEMEVWALEAYGAAYILREMLTVKSDDVVGRSKIYENIIRGEHAMDAGMPESFNVLVKEIRALGLNIELKQDPALPATESATGGTKMRDIFNLFKQSESVEDFSAIRVSIASPRQVREWSFGEVKKPETINYRTFRPERGGLFCAKLFGPVSDYECLCGKYKRLKHRGVICEKCGVEVTLSNVRRERMGHIELAAPCAHIWFLKSLPSRLGLLLDMTVREMERVLYFEAYVIIDPGMTDFARGDLLTEESYLDAIEKYGDEFEARMGAEAIRARLNELEKPLKEGDPELHLLKVTLSENEERAEQLRELVKADQTGEEFDSVHQAELTMVEAEIRELSEIFPNPTNLKWERSKLKTELRKTKSETKRKRFISRLKLIQAFIDSGNKPSWMILEVLPVLPPDLRPLVPLEGGRFATSDLNDLYRRVINRNNRLKRLLDLNAPDLIVRNEKRMLQESVDALLDNGRRGKAIAGANKRQLKSISDMIKGKQGRFRQNLLGKRVDYSGRSVIVVGPTLKLHQCGLPKKMALELFKPFIFSKLELRGLSTTIKQAKKMVEMESPEVWDILEEVIREHPVMLNRAPTLHRLGIQAFEPVLIEGKAIQLHPLVCTPYNADFDGDQMAVHVPMSIEAQLEARSLMMSTNNILSPANGEPIIVPSQDIVLGLYYMTRESKSIEVKGNNKDLHYVNKKGEKIRYKDKKGKAIDGDEIRKYFADVNEVRRAWETGKVSLHAQIMVRLSEKYFPDAPPAGAKLIGERYTVKTTVGRALLSEILPEGLDFSRIDRSMKKKTISDLIDVSYRQVGLKETVIFADQLMYTGFKMAALSGISIGVDDMLIPEEKKKILAEAQKEVLEIREQYTGGLLTDGERYNKVVDIWSRTGEKVAESMLSKLSTEQVTDREGNQIEQDSFNSIYMMADSGARGSHAQIRQLAGMRGLMANPSGRIIETPITANFRQGLNVLEYFISTHGARKGLTDTALKTANAGYMTRRLVDVCQDLVVVEEDCGTENGLLREAQVQGGEVVVPLKARLLGRFGAEDIIDPASGKILVSREQLLDEKQVEKVEAANINKVRVRSAVTCETRYGVCAKCYGRDLGRGHVINIGEAAGVIAAQSIGEPGTQLTLRTFHIGGAASESRIGQIIVKNDGTIHLKGGKLLVNRKGKQVVLTNTNEMIIRDQNGRDRERHKLPYGAELLVKEGAEVAIGDCAAAWDPHANPIITEVAGKVRFIDMVEDATVTRQTDEMTARSAYLVLKPENRRGNVQDMRPAIMLENEDGSPVEIPGTGVARYLLPQESMVELKDGQEVHSGDILARVHKESTKARDITGGLPRVVELFEARKPKEPAILAQASGKVGFGTETKSKHRLVITDEEGKSHGVLIPKIRQIKVFDGQTVERGEEVVEGPPLASDILKYRGIEALADYIVNEVQDVYQLQGVTINDKHIEVIVRQMLRKVKITDVGAIAHLPGEQYLLGEQVEKTALLEQNDRLAQMLKITEPGDSDYPLGELVEEATLLEQNQQLAAQDKAAASAEPVHLAPAVFEPVLLGITKASLTTESFISAASFQETTRVLTDASVNGKIDRLRGLKENVIVGRLIPAGTGLVFHQERKRKQLESLQKDQELEELLNTVNEESEAPPDNALGEPESALTAE